MSRPLPFTAASITRLIKGIEAAPGHFVVGAKPDGTLIIGDKAIETTSLVPVPVPVQNDPAFEWEDQRG